VADVATIVTVDAEPPVRPIAPNLMFWAGVASGAALVVLLSATALSPHSHGRAVLGLLIATNLIFLARCLLRDPSPWTAAAFGLVRGLHWVLSMAVAGLALLLTLHAETPGRALALAGLSLLLVLSAAATRRLTLAPVSL
jgi:hypothetical protein